MENKETWEQRFSRRFTDNVLKDGYGNDLIENQASPIMKFIAKEKKNSYKLGHLNTLQEAVEVVESKIVENPREGAVSYIGICPSCRYVEKQCRCATNNTLRHAVEALKNLTTK